MKKTIEHNYADVKICHSLQEYSADWQQLGRGIEMGRAISPILFTAAFEVIMIDTRILVRCVHNSPVASTVLLFR